MAKKIFIIAGEASGDLHGKNLVKALLEKDPTVKIYAYGGQKMKNAGADIVRDYEGFTFMGFYEVAKNIKTVLSNIKITENLIKEIQPDILIFIDFPGFNLRIAKSLKPKLKNTKFYFYIAPQVWAWKSKRVHILNQLMDRIFVILPFEKDFFAKFNYEVDYVGHPLLDEIGNIYKKEKKPKLIAILPGSRKQEIQKILPVFKELAKALPDFHFKVSTMKEISMDFYDTILKDDISIPNLEYANCTTYELLQEAHLAIVTSGTATLETALFNTPQIVAYKTSTISYWIAKRIVKIKYISLVNLILDKCAITELIQDSLNLENLKSEILKLEQPGNYQKVLDDYSILRQALGKGGASKTVAEKILEP